MNVDLYYKFELRDQDGKLVNRPRFKKSHSYVHGHIVSLYCMFADLNFSMPNINGVGDNYSNNVIQLGMGGVANQPTLGLVVGFGTLAPSINDYAMGSLCISGTTTNLLSYAAVSFASPNTSGGKRFLRMSRAFVNNSGATITIQEVGGYMRDGKTGVSMEFFLSFRDLSTLVIPDGNSATLVYEESVTV